MRSLAFRTSRNVALSLAFVLLLAHPRSTSAQVVSTFASVRGATGLATDGAFGNLYIGSRNKPNSVVYICTPPSNLLTVLALVTDPIGLLADPVSGYLYIADLGSNSIVKVPLAGGPPATLASVPGPGWLTMDGAGNLYVAQYAGQTIYKITPTGVVSVYVTGFPFPPPGLGPISMSATGVLYAATFGGAVYSIGAGGTPITPFSTLPACGSLVPGFSGWFAGTYNHDTIDQIGPSGGPVTIFAGQDLVAGHVDGPIPAATFNGVNGIAWLGNDLYVAESGNNDVREITTGATPVRSSTWGSLKALYH